MNSFETQLNRNCFIVWGSVVIPSWFWSAFLTALSKFGLTVIAFNGKRMCFDRFSVIVKGHWFCLAEGMAPKQAWSWCLTMVGSLAVWFLLWLFQASIPPPNAPTTPAHPNPTHVLCAAQTLVMWLLSQHNRSASPLAGGLERASVSMVTEWRHRFRLSPGPS